MALDNPFLGADEDLATGLNISNPFTDWVSGLFSGSGSSGGISMGSLLATLGGGAAGFAGSGSSSQKPTGYQGTVPKYEAVRQQVPMAEQDPMRRPGSGGRQYFTNTQYIPQADTSGIAGAQQAMQAQSNAIAQANLAANPGLRTQQLNAAQSIYPNFAPAIARPSTAPAANTDTSGGSSGDTSGGAADNNTDWFAGDGGYRGGHIPNFAQGGITALAQGRYLRGNTDGMADKIPAVIEGKKPAALGHGEFVLPSDCVSALGSGNSEAGAKVLYDMMDRIRKHAHGHTKQIKPANLKKVLPA